MAGYLDSVGASAGGYAATPHHADLNTGVDIDIRVCVDLTDPETSNTYQPIVTKGQHDSGSNYSFYFTQERQSGVTRGLFGFQENTTLNAREVLTTSALGDYFVAGPRWYRVTMDGDNGASQRVHDFYYSDEPPTTDPDSVTWTLFESRVLSIGVGIGINNTNTPVYLARNTNTTPGNFDGKFYYAEIRSSIGGTKVANPDFRIDDQYDSATQLTDDFGKIWTVNSPAVWVIEHARTVVDSLGLGDAGQCVLVLDSEYELGLVDSGTADLYTPADVLGLSDSVIVDYTPGGVERTVTDELGLADQGTAALIVEGQSFDLLGLEDSGQADLFASADLLGLVDQVTVSFGFGRVLDDSLGLTDSIVQELTGAGEERTVTDTVGLTDSGSVDQVADQLGITDVILVDLNPIEAAATDDLGLEDSGTADSFGDADFLGLVDSLVVEFTGAGLTATVDDSLGLTDQITVVISKILETTDALGLVDSGTADRFGNADLLGLTDTVAAEVTGAGEAVITDPLGLADTTTQESVSQRSQLDGLGLLDSAAQEITTERSQTDPLGLLDAISAESQSIRDQTNDLGLTDSITVELIGAGEALVTDPLELTDTGTGLFEADSDLLGLTDTVFYTTGGSETRTVDDGLGLTDTVASATDSQQIVSDTLGLTDTTGTATDASRSVADLLGFADSIKVDLSGVADVVISDPFGFTDNATTTVSWQRSASDNLGLTDSVISELTGADEVIKTDSLGLTDTTTRTAETARIRTDALGLTDSIDVVLIGQELTVSITDLLGLIDQIDKAGGHQRFINDLLGLADAISRIIDYDLALADALGLTDSITRQISGPDFWKPRPVPYTKNPVPHTKVPVAYVPVGPDDTPPWN